MLFCCGCVRNRDEDEGIPSENEEEKKMLDTKARELKGKAGWKRSEALSGGVCSPVGSPLLLHPRAIPAGM